MLRNYGPKGQSVGKIVDEMAERGLRVFGTARNAKSSVASTCANDTAFARVAPGTFALRAVPGVVEVSPLTGPSNLLTAVHCAQQLKWGLHLPAPGICSLIAVLAKLRQGMGSLFTWSCPLIR